MEDQMTITKQNRSQLFNTLAVVIAEVSNRHNPEDAAAAIWPARLAEQALLQATRFTTGSDDYRSALRSARSEIQVLREIAALGIVEVKRLTAEKELADRKAHLQREIETHERQAITNIKCGQPMSDRQRRRNFEKLNKCRAAVAA
jgi:hypothetical protein